jgi:hypothetical protein
VIGLKVEMEGGGGSASVSLSVDGEEVCKAVGLPKDACGGDWFFAVSGESEEISLVSLRV